MVINFFSSTGDCLICPSQRLTLSRIFPAAGPSITNEMSAVAPFSPRTRKLARRICDKGCASQFFGISAVAEEAGAVSDEAAGEEALVGIIEESDGGGGDSRGALETR